MRKKRKKYYFFFLFFLLSVGIYSKEIKEPPHPKQSDGPGPYPELPIDGGVSFLIIIGAIYGICKSKKP